MALLFCIVECVYEVTHQGITMDDTLKLLADSEYLHEKVVIHLDCCFVRVDLVYPGFGQAIFLPTGEISKSIH